MIIVTTLDVQGKQIKHTLGMVRGSSIRSRHIGQDIIFQTSMVMAGAAEMLCYGTAVTFEPSS